MPDDENAVRQVLVRVSVHLPGGQHCQESARVILRQGALTQQLRRPPGSLLYEGIIEPGTYLLEASAGELISPSRDVVVPREGKTASAYLGKAGWPFYRLGENVVPFEPRDDLVAIAFDVDTPKPAYIAKSVDRLRRDLGLRPFLLDPEKPQSFLAANGAIWLFSRPQGQLESNLAQQIVTILGRDARVGIPVDLTAGQVSLLDNRFVVRFRDHFTSDRIKTLVEAADGRVLRGFIQSRNAWLIEFRQGGYLQQLGVLERWREAEYLIYGEPDLLSEFVDHAFPATPPNDTKYGVQDSLRLQGVDLAWQYLKSIGGGAKLTLGSPGVCVMSLDTGVERKHSDIGGKLTDGKKQLAVCYDFDGRRSCSASGYTANYHGMSVYGIIAARTNNKKGIAGIAPNTRQLAVKHPPLVSATYADVLMWAAGFVTGTAKPWPAEPIAHPADIINCSHGKEGLALSGLMDDTFEYLTTQGRNGLGTLLVYAAGNSSTLITGFLTWAADCRTLAVANSDPRVAGVETINPGSNFGPEIDLCAQGEGAWSLTLKAQGYTRQFAGTSAAAAMVSGAAALMLSANPTLRWTDLRDILRDTAKKRGDGIGRPGEWAGQFSQYYGHGRLDVDAAVRAARAFPSGP